jgi:hypothetical protein
MLSALGRVLLGLSRRWLAWAVAGGLLLAAALVWTVGPGVSSKIALWRAGVPQALKANQAARADLEAAREQLLKTAKERDGVVQQARVLRAQHAAAMKRAGEAEARARQAERAAMALRAQVAQLDAERRALRPVSTVHEGYEELKRFGFEGR